MNTDIETAAGAGYERGTRKRSKPSVAAFLVVWVLLIGAGVLGTITYANHMKAAITADVERQTAEQIAAMQQDYQTQIDRMKTDYTGEVTKLQGKVDALNQLLTFTKDNTSDKTDNSNQLYTQINEVKIKLTELEKSLDVLK
jgi:peptidoglycan hydrolase CwlO-like protein